MSNKVEENQKNDNQSNKQTTGQGSFIIQRLFEVGEPDKQYEGSIGDDPTKYGFELTNRNVAFRPVTLSKDGPIVGYDVLQVNQLNPAQKPSLKPALSIENYMSQTLRSLHLECRDIIEDVRELVRIEEEREMHFLSQHPNK